MNKSFSLLTGFNLEQLQREPTRGKNVLDYICTNNPGSAKSNHSIPGVSDHEIIIFDSDLRAWYTRLQPRRIYMYSKADWDFIWENAKTFALDLLDSFSRRNVYEIMKNFKFTFIRLLKTIFLANSAHPGSTSLGLQIVSDVCAGKTAAAQVGLKERVNHDTGENSDCTKNTPSGYCARQDGVTLITS